ncbi:MAG: GAF and ANTAR domain-containing protein [Mycobacterium sp.]|nr:GAF and ANTAR domain-containing protein [Mycobacterium sp.]
MPNHDLAVKMAELARSMAGPIGVEQVLSEVTEAAIELIPGADAAGVLLIGKGGTFDSLAGTSGLPHELDELQMKHKEGPCLQAAVDELVVRSDDFETETRWPHYTRDALALGVRGGLSFKLYTADRTAGALNLFAFEPGVFDSESEAIGSVLAAQAAAAIIASRRGEQLQSALLSRDVIGQAKGVIMERFNIDAVQAFALLRELSQSSNTKLSDVAQRVLDTRGQ